MDLPLSYISDVISRSCKRVKVVHNEHYNFECPICREGTSSGRKRRGYYFIPKAYFYCQNCQRSWSPVNWVMAVESASFEDVMKEARSHGNTFTEILTKAPAERKPVLAVPSLPHDSINLSDPIQLQYHRNNKDVQTCLRYISSRRLNTAVNKPKTFYLSLTDPIHRNRLCIPFYDTSGKIIFYQTRAIYDKDVEFGKYLSKKDSDKSLYGISNIDSAEDTIFIFEGPINSMFCKNGVAACGLTLTVKQEAQLDMFRLHDRVWVLDNDIQTPEVYEKYNRLIDSGASIFLWPEEFDIYKDVNDVCIATARDSIPKQLILSNTFSGLKAKMRLSELYQRRIKSSLSFPLSQ